MPRAYPNLKKGFNPKAKRPKDALDCVVERRIDFDNGNNAIGHFAVRMPAGHIVKFNFYWENESSQVKLVVYRKGPAGIKHPFPIQNLLVERLCWEMLRRENLLSEQLSRKVFARFT